MLKQIGRENPREDSKSVSRGDWTAPLEFWSGTNFRWGELPSGALPSLFIKFNASPDGKVGSLMFNLGPDTAFMVRKPVPAPRAAGTP